jgi:hypothetical protein
MDTRTSEAGPAGLAVRPYLVHGPDPGLKLQVGAGTSQGIKLLGSKESGQLRLTEGLGDFPNRDSDWPNMAGALDHIEHRPGSLR